MCALGTTVAGQPARRERAMLRDRDRDRRAQAEAEWRRVMRDDLEKYESDDDREPWERRPLSGT